MRSFAIIILACGSAAALVGAAADAAPEAGLSANTWQLDFAFRDPQRFSIRLPGDAADTTYWYMLYVVTNNTGRDVMFYPSFRIVTDRLQVVEAGANIHPRVYDAIAARHKKDHPFFAPPSKVTGLLLQGEDNARTSAAVFRAFDDNVDAFRVFAAGLSGDVTRVANPGFDPARPESDANPRFFVLRRTLALSYQLPGDAETRSRVAPVRRSRAWVMR
ncbi:MAG: hypothetical protein ACE5E6_12700 [Phycisphaerae bacterium]